jgi:hypothetical protein
MTIRRLVSRLALVGALVVSTAAMANAGAWIQWANGSQTELTKVEIPVAERQSPLEQYVYQLGSDWYTGYEFPLEVGYPNHITGVGGGDSFLDEKGQPIYVRIGQAVTNTGQTAWSDFHIRVRDGGVPYKIFGSWWPSDWNISGVSDGWDFVRASDSVTTVKPGQVLYDEVWIRVDPTVNAFSMEKWPTVPEPSSILGLMGGLFALGSGIKLRRSGK